MADLLPTLVLASAGGASEPSGGLGFISAGLVIFLVVFVSICVWAIAGRRGRFDAQASIPLHDEPVTPIETSSRGGA